RSLAFSPDGNHLAVGTRTGSIHVWELNKDNEGGPRNWRAHQGSALGLAFHPNRPVLGSGGEDGTVKFWDLTGDKGAAPKELASPQAPKQGEINQIMYVGSEWLCVGKNWCGTLP